MPPLSSPPPRASLAEWVQTALVALNLGWTSLGLGGYPPATMVVTSMLTGLLVAVHFAARSIGRDGRTHPAGWLLVPFLVYAAANVVWVSPVRWLGWIEWFGWAQMIAVFWVVLNGIRSRAPRAALFGTLVAIALISVAMGCYQRIANPNWLPFGHVRPPQFGDRASGPFAIPNSLAALLLLVLPAVGAICLRRHGRATERVWWGWVTAVLSLGLVLTISRGAWLALALALTSWPLLAARGGWFRRVAIAAGVVAAVGATTVIVLEASPQARDRFMLLARDAGERSRPIIWRAAWQLFRSAPAFGTGAASYDVRFESHRPEGFLDDPQWAHNDYLNTLSDYGAVGAVLFFGAGLVIAAQCARHRRDSDRREDDWFDRRKTTAALAVGLLAFAFQLFLDFHFKLPALAMAFATVAALVTGRMWPVPSAALAGGAGRRVGAMAIGIAAAGAILITFEPAFRAEAVREQARRAIDRMAVSSSPGSELPRIELASIRRDLARATVLDPSNAQAWADLAYALSLWARVDMGRDGELGQEAERAASRALALSTACSEFWIRRGVARDMQGRWLEAGNDFAKALELAPHNPLPWFYHADHLSRRRSERALAEAALAFCLRLDPGNHAGIALRQRLAISSQVP